MHIIVIFIVEAIEPASHVREMIQNQIHMEPDQDFDDDDVDDEDSDELAMDLDSFEEKEKRKGKKMKFRFKNLVKTKIPNGQISTKKKKNQKREKATILHFPKECCYNVQTKKDAGLLQSLWNMAELC